MSSLLNHQIASIDDISDEDVEIVKKVLFGTADLRITEQSVYAPNAPNRGVSGTPDRVIVTAPDNETIRKVIFAMNHLYVREFARSMADFARQPIGIRKHHAAREAGFLRTFLYGRNVSFIVCPQGGPSIRFGSTPPTRLHVDATTASFPTDEDPLGL